MLGRTVLVSEGDASLGDIGVHPRGDGLRLRILRVADHEIVSWREQRAHAHEDIALSARVSVHDTMLAIPS